MAPDQPLKLPTCYLTKSYGTLTPNKSSNTGLTDPEGTHCGDEHGNDWLPLPLVKNIFLGFPTLFNIFDVFC